MSRVDLVMGLPRPALVAAPPPAHVLGDGPLCGDELFGLLRGDRAAVGVADDVGRAPVHDGPEPFGEAGGHDAAGRRTFAITIN
jgi:hypothetical protein